MGTGSTFKAISKKALNSFPISLYPEITQSAIEKQLDWAIHELEAANRQLSVLDSLVKSRFVEMFMTGEYPLAEIGDCADDIRYGTSQKASDEGEFVYLRMNNMTDDGNLDINDVKRITLSGKQLENCLVRKGDLLFNRTNSREKIGKTCVFSFDEPMVIAGYIIRVRLNQRVNAIYLSNFMNLSSTKKMMRGMAKGAVHQANINAKQLASIAFPFPPLALQQEFAAFAAQVDKSRFAIPLRPHEMYFRCDLFTLSWSTIA